MTSCPWRRQACLRGLVSIAIALGASTASADVARATCIDSNAKAQDLRRDHKLALARVELLQCADPSCPRLVRDDCTDRLAELEQAQPTVVFDVVDPGGAFLAGVKVAADGVPHPELSSGAALRLDPGTHTVTFESSGFLPLTRTVVMIEGDRGHHERVALAVGNRRAVAAPAPPSMWDDWQSRASVVSAGLGIAGLVTGGVFGALTLSQKSAQETACPSSCSASAHAQADSDHSAGMTDSVASTVAFIAGGALLATGVTLWLTRPVSSSTSATLSLAPTVGPGGGTLVMFGRF